MHHGCKGKKAKCPDAKHSHNWCDYCNLKKETVKAPPESEKNRICGDCHQSGSLPEQEEWWDERQPETDAKCPRCDSDFGMVSTVSCTDCGYIPEEHQA
jgi:DNA-directed RNA polymerase subunit RPC12/RpoP